MGTATSGLWAVFLIRIMQGCTSLGAWLFDCQSVTQYGCRISDSPHNTDWTPTRVVLLRNLSSDAIGRSHCTVACDGQRYYPGDHFRWKYISDNPFPQFSEACVSPSFQSSLIKEQSAFLSLYFMRFDSLQWKLPCLSLKPSVRFILAPFLRIVLKHPRIGLPTLSAPTFTMKFFAKPYAGRH